MTASKRKPWPWSYSRIKAFETCPKQFYHTKILKEYPQEETEAMLYGTQFHEAAEFYVRDRKPLEPRFEFARPILDALARLKGDKLCELEMGVTENLDPCFFDANDVWYRGICDLTIVNRETWKGYAIDYKTGKNTRYADRGQLELMALSMFAHYSRLQSVKGSLLFVVANEPIDETYTRDDIPRLWGKWTKKYNRMAKAFETDTWNPNPSGLCKKHCPVTTCPHNGYNK